VNASPRIRVLLVDDHAVVRAGYRALIESEPRFAVVDEAEDGERAYRRTHAGDIDVVVLDLAMPGQGGLSAAQRIAAREPAPRVLVFSMHAHPSFAAQAFAAGALGYVTKSSPPATLLEALASVAQGRRYLSADIAQALALARFGSAHARLETLTVREFEVLRLLLAAHAVEDIAATLHLSVKTVRNLHYAVKRKLEVRDDIELVRLALRLEVVDLVDFAAIAPALPAG
jgi:two-component system, NarL family, invasion response regulator UvrY